MQHAFPFPRPPLSLFASEDHRHAVHRLLSAGALFAINSSGGKDSQAMTILLERIIPPEQMIVVHAPLRDVEWPGTIEHIEHTMPTDVPLLLAHISSGQTLLERVETRGMFPGPRWRWCTSDFKRGPIERELRRFLKAHPRFGGRIVNCMGMRADESSDRARLVPWKHNNLNSKAGRDWYDWLPVHAFSTTDVFRVIEQAGQQPHWAYAEGATRVSCIFCLYGTPQDFRIGARLYPNLYRRYADIERRTGHTLSPSRRTLPTITGIPA